MDKYHEHQGDSGKPSYVKRQSSQPAGSERRSTSKGPRPADGERRSYGDRPRPADGERRAFSKGPRPADGERRSYGDRPRPADGARRTFNKGPRPADGERRSYGDRPRPAEGERRTFSKGPRPVNGERRSFSDRPRPVEGDRRNFSNDQRPASTRQPKRDFSPVPAVPTDTAIDDYVKPTPQLVPELPIPQILDEGAGLPDRLEGRNPIQEAIKAGRAINKIWVTKREERQDPSLGRLIAQARDAGAVIMEVEKRVLDAMSTTHSHQGIIAQVAAHEYIELDELISNIKARNEVPFLLILAELQESYNLGSILRIADAAGVQGVIIPMRRSVGLDAAVAKASAGAIEHVPVARVGNLTQTIQTLKDQGFWIAGTDAEGKTDYRNADWTGPLAILIGSEGEGLSPIMRRHCDFLISIPMFGKVNSLNAAVAAGIITFEAAAKRHAAQTAGNPAKAAPAAEPVAED